MSNARILAALRLRAKYWPTVLDFIAWNTACEAAGSDMQEIYIQLFGIKIGSDLIQIYNKLITE